MSRENDGLVRKTSDRLKTVIHQLGIASGQIGTTTSIEEEGVARNQCAVKVKALASGCVAWRVNEVDGERTDTNLVASFMCGDLGRVNSSGPRDPRNFKLVRVEGNVDGLQERGEPFNGVTHH